MLRAIVNTRMTRTRHGLLAGTTNIISDEFHDGLVTIFRQLFLQSTIFNGFFWVSTKLRVLIFEKRNTRGNVAEKLNCVRVLTF